MRFACAMATSFEVQFDAFVGSPPNDTPEVVPDGAATISFAMHAPLSLKGTVSLYEGFCPGTTPLLGDSVELSLHATNAARAPTNAQARKKLRFIIGVPPYDK